MQTPLDVYRIIHNELAFRTQIKLRLVKKWFHKRLPVVDFYNIAPKYKHRLTNDILRQHTRIKFLDVSLTRAEIAQRNYILQYWSNLFRLTQYAIDIGHLNLHTLNIRGTVIQGETYEHMNLHTFYPNCLTTNDNIKHMHLAKLYLDSTFFGKITNDSVGGFCLHTLHADTGITSSCLRGMNLYELVMGRGALFEQDICHMNLHTLERGHFTEIQYDIENGTRYYIKN